MDATFIFRSMIICDEVREEIGGKQIIIGLYSGVILLPFIPFYASKLTIRFEIKTHISHYEHAECTVLRPNGSIFCHEAMMYDVKLPEFPTSMLFTLTGLNFEHTGDYTVLLAMDSTPVTVGSFSIVTPENVPQRT